MEYRIVRNTEYGFFEVENKPTQKELSEYYAKKYYKDDADKKNQYQEKYKQSDIEYIVSKIENKYELLVQNKGLKSITSFIDIGCGEGFALNYFANKNINVLGVDYSDYGIKNHNPNQLSNFRQGNVNEVVEDLIREGQTFDVIWIDNVLEHVIQPEDLIQKCNKLCAPNGFIIIEVPNDYSTYQNYLLHEGLINKHYWKITPDHLNYFSPESLKKLCQSNGFQFVSHMTDFPIQLFLLNENSNYYTKKQTGKAAHKSRLAFEKYIKSVNSNEQIVKLYQTLLESGLGRQIIGLYQKI